MKQRLIRFLRRRKWGAILLFAILNRRTRRLVESGTRVDTTGQTRDAATSEGVTYVESTYESLVEQSGIGEAEIQGCRVLELGPGDNLGLALRLIAAGAEQLVTLDRFDVDRDSERERMIYEELLSRLPDVERARASAALEPETTLLRPVSGIGVERALDVLEPESFDLIISVAVLEHVSDPDASFAAMDALLKPGGRMLHQIDLRDHEMFSGGGQHPLTFLTVGPRTWRAISDDWGGPNRHLIDYYRRKLHELGYEARLLVNQVLGAREKVPARDALTEGVEVSDEQRRLIGGIRPRLQPQFRELSDEDLAAAGVLLTARKPSMGS